MGGKDIAHSVPPSIKFIHLLGFATLQVKRHMQEVPWEYVKHAYQELYGTPQILLSSQVILNLKNDQHE